MAANTHWDTKVVISIIRDLKDKPGALLPILHAIQDSQGYIPLESVVLIAESLNQTRAEIHGVLTFYTHFRTAPPASSIVQICRAEACQARGSRALEKHAKRQLRIDYHETTMDGQFSLEPVYCLGNCARGPSVRIDDDLVGGVSPEKFDRLINVQ